MRFVIMKNLWLLALILLFALPASAQFRNTTWGMSVNQVKRIEKSKSISDYNGDLKYQVELGDVECQLRYTFANDKLIEILYIFTPPINSYTTTRSQSIQTLWKSTLDNLIKKYGVPVNKTGENYFLWGLENFSIRARVDREVKVSYTPPTPTQLDIL